MIAAGAFVDLRRAAKVSQHHDERLVEASALLQIFHQRRGGLVEGREHIVF